MRDYLLGTLDGDCRTKLEERILCDPAVYEELLLVEEELIDQYVAGGLSKLEQHQFETHFLVTAERQKNLRFGKLLKRYFDSHPFIADKYVPVGVGSAPENDSLPFYLAYFRTRRWVTVPAAIMVCLGIVFLSWTIVRKSAEGPLTPNTSHLIAVPLAPGSMRSAGTTQRVRVPPIGFDVQLELELANSSFDNYKSQLIRESQALETTAELKKETKGDHYIVPVTITRDLLRPGDYQVRLSGVLDSGEDEFIDNYSFRVTTE